MYQAYAREANTCQYVAPIAISTTQKAVRYAFSLAVSRDNPRQYNGIQQASWWGRLAVTSGRFVPPPLATCRPIRRRVAPEQTGCHGCLRQTHAYFLSRMYADAQNGTLVNSIKTFGGLATRFRPPPVPAMKLLLQPIHAARHSAQ